MQTQKSSRFTPFLVACILGSIGILAAEPALADKRLFRVQRSSLGVPRPAVTYPTSYGGAGRYINHLQPYKPFTRTASYMGATMGPGTGTPLPPGWATVDPGNAIGAKFTLPSSFIDYSGTRTRYPGTASFYVDFTRSVLDYVNLEAHFRPNNPYGATTPTTVTFSDIIPGGVTTTHAGNFDFSRNGYMKITPGGNHFGGTMRYLHAPTSLLYQYISYSYAPPTFAFKGYGSFVCTKMGVDCATPSYEQEFEAILSRMVSRYLLSPTIIPYTTPTPWGKTGYRKIRTPVAISKNYYLNLSGPWTTGSIDVFIPTPTSVASYVGAHPTAAGYDRSLSGADITLLRTHTSVIYKGFGKTYYPTKKYYSTLKGVTRVVSLVKPRILHVYQDPRIVEDPIRRKYGVPRIERMKVFFLPEPGAMLMLGSGIAGLAALALLRRR
jgi:hypothetical protein